MTSSPFCSHSDNPLQNVRYVVQSLPILMIMIFLLDVWSSLSGDQLPVCQVWAQQGLLLDAGSKAETELLKFKFMLWSGNLGICLDANGSSIRVHWNCENLLKSIFSSPRWSTSLVSTGASSSSQRLASLSWPASLRRWKCSQYASYTSRIQLYLRSD